MRKNHFTVIPKIFKIIDKDLYYWTYQERPTQVGVLYKILSEDFASDFPIYGGYARIMGFWDLFSIYLYHHDTGNADRSLEGGKFSTIFEYEHNKT